MDGIDQCSPSVKLKVVAKLSFYGHFICCSVDIFAEKEKFVQLIKDDFISRMNGLPRDGLDFKQLSVLSFFSRTWFGCCCPAVSTSDAPTTI